MNMKMLVMTLVGGGLLTLASPAAEQADGEKIGVYDSRCIAITAINVHLQTPEGKKEVAEKNAEYEKLKAAGDKNKLAAFEAQQIKVHKQGFGTAPVDEYLERIKDKLPELMKKAGVNALVSKWDEKGLKQHKGAKQVDVTEALVEAFGPDAKLRASALEIQKKKPVPNKLLENAKD